MRIYWNKVTWYSKVLAIIMFISLPFVGFWLGMKYQFILDKIHFNEELARILSAGLSIK